MAISLPIFQALEVRGYQMYPGLPGEDGFAHNFTPGLHLVAGVNGLGKSTLLLMLYHGIVGPAAVHGDEFGVPRPEVIPTRAADKFRRRVADGAKSAHLIIHFTVGADSFYARRLLYDLSLVEWSHNGSAQQPDEDLYKGTVTQAMNVGGFADVLAILNLIVFMFEDRGLLMWSSLAQRNALRALFMSPDEANVLAERAQSVGTANSAYRNLNYIVNRDRKQLNKDRAALAGADALSAEFHTLQKAVSAQNEVLEKLIETRLALDTARVEARATFENAKYNLDDLVRELEALKIARIAGAFPSATDAGHYVIARLVGDRECLSCGSEDGPLVDKWIAAIAEGDCLICGSKPAAQEIIVPVVAVDSARIAKIEARIEQARLALDSASKENGLCASQYDACQGEIDKLIVDKSASEKRIEQIAGSVPPSPPAVAALEERIKAQEKTLADLQKKQRLAEVDFSEVFGAFKQSIEDRADKIRERFIARISEFLVERAEITLVTSRAPVGESGQSYDWPSFQLSMTSGTFDNPSPRRLRSEVSMSQGEFIDLAFRLALVEVATGDHAAALVFDAPEASLDALFMRRAGAFLAEFTAANPQNRLIVTSNLTNADMIPALFGAFVPEEGDPQPSIIPRSERRSRVIDLLEIAAPTSAVTLVGDRYKNLLDQALFPPSGAGVAGL